MFSGYVAKCMNVYSAVRPLNLDMNVTKRRNGKPLETSNPTSTSAIASGTRLALTQYQTTTSTAQNCY